MTRVHSVCINLCDVAYVHVDYVVICVLVTMHRSLVKGVGNFQPICKEWWSNNGGGSPYNIACGQHIFH